MSFKYISSMVKFTSDVSLLNFYLDDISVGGRVGSEVTYCYCIWDLSFFFMSSYVYFI
jgi:hypothetical protein